MHTIGLIGGMSWYSTLEYYRVINTAVQERLGGHASAPLSLQSLDFAGVRDLQIAGDWAGAGRLLAEAGRRCELGGAEAVLICTNLMHRVAEEVDAAIGVPLLHICDAIAQQALAQGWTTVGLMATRWVMEEDFYVERLRRHGLHVLVPEAADRAEIDRVIFEELTQGVVEESSRQRYRQIMDGLAGAGAQAVVLGCTEIELLVDRERAPLPLLDSMRTHAEVAAQVVLDGVQVRPPTHPEPLPRTGADA